MWFAPARFGKAENSQRTPDDCATVVLVHCFYIAIVRKSIE